MKLVMTLLVRDEEDVLRANFECHLRQGVDFFIVMDNLSVDGTRDIIEEYVRSGVAARLDQPDDDFSQARWVTEMARLAATRYGADWVINSDADEFWIGNSSGGAKADLSSLDPQVPCVVVERSNFPPVDEYGAGCFAERMTLRERFSYNAMGQALPPKTCHRAAGDVEIDQGNHAVRRRGAFLEGARGILRILHYPARSYPQFENKIVKGGAAYARNRQLSVDVGQTWRQLHALWQAGGLRDYYNQMIVTPERADRGLRSGTLVKDRTLAEILSKELAIS